MPGMQCVHMKSAGKKIDCVVVSPTCDTLSHKKKSTRIEVPCDWCGEMLLRTQDKINKVKNSYCDKECFDSAQRQTKVQIPCGACGVVMTLSPFRQWQSAIQYCSNACVAMGNRSRRAPKFCKHCGVEFEGTKGAKLCEVCHDHQFELRPPQPKGIDNPQWKPRITLTCETCEESFEVKQSRRDTARFCSKSCRMIAQVMPRVSSIELVVAAHLDDQGIAYDQQVRIKRFIADFVTGNTVIEVDGDYWHTLPGIPEKDARKDLTYRELGYNVIRIWEHEINAGDLSKLNVLSA